MLISDHNWKAALQDHKDGFNIYYEQVKRYFPNRHKEADYKWLARNSVSKARYYRDMMEQCEYIGSAFSELKEFING
jgi:hypothetical protein